MIQFPSGATCQACTEVGMEAGEKQHHSLLRRKQRLLPEALSTRKLQGQDLTAQPEVLLGPPCINDSTISFMFHKPQAILGKVYMSQCYVYFQSAAIATIKFRIYLLLSLPQICTLSAHKPLFLSAPRI